MNCSEFFTTNEDNKSKCKLLRDYSEETLVVWENETATQWSPGPVNDDEVLYRQIFDPTHIDLPSQTLKPNAFQDASNKGLSVNRLRLVSRDVLIESGKAKVHKFNLDFPEKDPKSLWGLLRIQVSKIRSMTVKFDDDPIPVRTFFIYDTAMKDVESHADICECIRKKGHERSVRSKLYDMAKAEGLEKL